MNRKLIVHEIRQIAADRTFCALVLLSIVVLGFGLWNGQRWVAYQHRVIAAAEEEQAQALARAKAQAERVRAGKEEVSWWMSAADTRGFVETHLVSFASNPPAPLAVLSIGQSDVYPYVLKITTEHQSGLVNTYETVNVRKLLLGPFDLAFAVIYFLPLFILALCYDVIAGEKEQGILGLLASQPISLPRLVLLKICSRLLLVIGVVVLLLGTILGLMGIEFSAPGVPGQLLTWFFVVVAYCVFWFFLGLLIIARGWKSATNALALAALWLVLVILLPAGISAWITSNYRLPSRVEFIKTLRDTEDYAWNNSVDLKEKFFIDHPQLKPRDKGAEKAAEWPVVSREINRRLQAAELDFAVQLERQQNLAEQLKFLSPALLVYSAFIDLAGTGISRQREFLSQVARYHAELEDYFVQKLVRQDYDFSGYDEFPRFQYRGPDREGLQSGVVSLVVLMGQALVLGIAGLSHLRRYPLCD